MADRPGGWGFPGGSRKAHYFPENDSLALCERWGFYFGPREPDTGEASPDDCALCRKRLAARQPA